MNIIIQKGSLFGNEGDVAMALSTMELIKESIPNANIYFLTENMQLDENRRKAFDLDIKLIPIESTGGRLMIFLYFILSSILKINPKYYIRKKILPKLYFESDLVVDIGGDMLSDSYGRECGYQQLVKIIFPILFNAKVVIFPQSIGPFESFKNRMLAKYALNRCACVIPRERITLNILQKLGIKSIYKRIINDIAFYLRPAGGNELNHIIKELGIDKDKNELYFGFGISRAIGRFRDRNKGDSIEQHYIRNVLSAIEYIVEKYNGKIILVPHVKGPLERHDDRITCKVIFERSKYKDHLYLIQKDYNARELKGIISQCNLFIGARMHSNIAALSLSVPTIAISYSHKFRGIMEQMGQVNYVLDVQDLNKERLCQLIDRVWERRNIIKAELRKKKEEIEKDKQELTGILQALLNG